MLTRVLSATACAALLFALPGAAPCDAERPRDAIYSCAYVPDAIDFAGSILLYLRNSGDEPLTISEIALDGVPIGTIWPSDESFLAADVRERYIAIENDRLAWYRVYPNPIPPGGIAEVILRLNPPPPEQEPQPQSTLSVTFAGQEPVETTVAMEAPPFVLEYVGIEPNLRVLHLYARAKPGVTARLDRVEIDGRPVSAEVRPVYSGLHYARVTLPRAWREASYHAAAIGDGDALSATLIRALPAPAPIGIMGNTGDEVLQEYRNKLFEASLAFTPAPLDTYERLARYDMVGSYIYGRKTQPEAEKFTEPVYYDQFDFGENRNLQQIKQQPALWAWFLEDEPDGRYHRTELPRGSISRDVERANQFCRVFDPGTPVYLQIDHGSYPRNLYTFGQIPDYLCTHAYALGTQNVVSTSQEHVAHTRNATRPRPFYYLNTGYCLREGTRVFEPREMQLEVYAALAEGAKSLQWYPAHGERGLLNHPEMWDAVGAMNGVLHQVLPLLAIGTPVDAPITDGGDILATAILCGDRAMAVVLVNRDFTADAERFVLNPAHTKVRVRLPSFMQAAGALEPRFPGATVPVEAELAGSVVEFETDVEAGKVIVIYADDAVPEQMRRTHAQCLRQYAVTPAAE